MLEKRGRSHACRSCRIRKRKCLPILEDDTGCCQLCKSQSISCSLIARSIKSHEIAPKSNQTPLAGGECVGNSSTSTGLLPPKHVLGDLVNLYFRLIHDGPHTLFHQPTFISRLDLGQLPEFLIFAVISLSARFSDHEYFRDDPREFAKRYAAAALDLLQRQMIRPSLESVQGYILISQHLGGEGDVKAKHICTGLARLHCQSIRLWETEGLSLVDQQVYKRTYLSTVITGKWSSADASVLPVSTEFPVENLLLLDEEDFLALHSRPSQHGMWTQMAKTIDLYREILDTLVRLGSGMTLASQLFHVSRLASRLDEWKYALPQRLRYSQENLEYFQQFGFGKTFLAMHIGYHHYRQLLYYPFLDPKNNDQLAYECKKHAIMVSEIARQGGELVYYIIGHILVVSSSIHLHTLLLGGGDVDKARVYLLSNFETLMRLKTYWPVIDIGVGRLRSFQNRCRVTSLESFVLDDWMWKFLINPSAVLDEQRQPKSRTRLSLIHNEDMSNDALVETALSWLLD